MYQHFLLLPSHIPLCGHIALAYPFLQLVDGRFDCFHFSAFVNNCAVSSHVRVLVWICISLVSGISGSYGHFVFVIITADRKQPS